MSMPIHIKQVAHGFDPNAFIVDENVRKVGFPNYHRNKAEIQKNIDPKIIPIKEKNRQLKRINEAAYTLGTDEITAIRTEITKVLRSKLKTQRIISTKNIGKGYLKYEYWDWKDVQPPRWNLEP